MSDSATDISALYGDYDKPLPPEAQDKFEYYTNKLAQLGAAVRQNDSNSLTSTSWQVWENGLRQIYKEMIYDAFETQGIDIPPDMEVHFAGSLAKAQATEFSDLDAFVLLKDQEDVSKVKPIFDGLNNLCQRVFKETNQLYPDPIGINPSRLIGTPDDLIRMLQNDEVADVQATARSILTSKPILPRYKLGEELSNKIKQDPAFNNFISAKKFYDMAISDFKGPKEGAQQVSVKSHIMRPIDFILMGLREEFNLYSEDGSHLSAPGTIRLLKEQNLIPQEDISRIESVYNQAMKTRFDMHAEHKKEHDEMPFAAAEEMLVEVEKIRTLGSQRIANIEHKENVAVAATLWEQANGMLEAADVVGYLKAAKNLHQFMGGKNISQDDMRRQLIDQEISPKAFAVLQEIYGAASDYSRNAASFTELSQECRSKIEMSPFGQSRNVTFSLLSNPFNKYPRGLGTESPF